MQQENNLPRETSLRDLVLKIREYIIYLWRKKFWVIGAAIISVAVFLYRASQEIPVFEGNLSFVVNENATASAGGVGAVLGQIGIGSSNSEYNLFKIVNLIRTRRIVTRMLMDSVDIRGVNDLVANHLIRGHNLQKPCSRIGKKYDNFMYTHDRVEDFSRVENQITKILYLMFVRTKNGILTVTHSDETGMVLIQAHANTEPLTQAILLKLFEALRDFYVENASSQHQETLDQLTEKADSVYAALNYTEYQLAKLQDRSLGISSRSELIRLDQLQRKANLLNGMYMEVLRNKEAADFLLKSTKPALRIVDPPIAPLASVEADYKVSAVLGVLFGGFVMSLLLLIRKGYLELMQA